MSLRFLRWCATASLFLAGAAYAQDPPPIDLNLPGNSCQNPIRVVEPGMMRGSTAGLQSAIGGQLACVDATAWDGPDVYFRVDLEAGERLRVTDTRAGGFNSGIYLFTQCGQPVDSCEAGCRGANCTASYKAAEDTTLYVGFDGAAGQQGDYGVYFDIEREGLGFQVVSIPWVGTAPEVPHDGVAGDWSYMQAVAFNCDQPIDFRWDFDGDGEWDMDWARAPNRWNLGTKHTWPADLQSSTLYIARVEGRCGEETDTAQFPIRARVDATKAQRVNRLISNGLWVGHIQSSRDANTRKMWWNRAPDTSVFAQAMLNRGHKIELNPLVDPYAEDVKWMTHYIIDRASRFNISPQAGGVDPDVNGNGYGFRFEGEENYGGGVQLEMVASVGDLDYKIPPTIGAPAEAVGRSVREIVADGAEYFYFSQSEIRFGDNPDGTPAYAGGWDYSRNSRSIDTSQVGWASVGLFAAEINTGLEVPQWVKDRLYTAVRYTDASRGGNQDRLGGYGYRGWNSCGANHARSGAMLNALGFAVDRNPVDPRVQATATYIGRNFNNGTPDCWGGQNLGNYYAMYQIAKGMRSFVPPIDLVELDTDADGVPDTNVDWYDQYVDFLLNSPNADGRFQNDNRWMRSRQIVHGLGLLILIPSIFETPPVAVANANPRSVGPGDVITFNHRSSYNPDPTVPIVTYRWNFIDYPVGLDLNGDGDFDDEGEFPPEDLNGDGVVTNDEVVWEVVTQDRDRTPTFTFSPELEFGEERVYRVVLQVEDVLGRVGIDDESVVIRVAIINHPPVALPHPSGDPDAAYQVVPGRTYTLDGRASFDTDSDDEPIGDAPVDFITYYGWDLDLDGEYDVEAPTAEFAVPADWQVGDIRTVQFLVCDDGTWAGIPDEECEGGDCSLCSRQTARLRVVPNTPPTAGVEQGPRIPEGDRRIVRAEPQGPGGAPVTYDWVCPEGVAFEVIEEGAAIEVDAANLDGIEDGTEIGCRLTVRDDLGDSASVAFTVTVTNRPPEIEAVQAEPNVQEGGSATITIAATDPAAADRAGLLYSVDCDGDGVLDVIDSPDNEIECVYGDDGVYEPVVLVTDDDGGMAIAPAGQVVVENVGPRVAAVECPPSREGTPVTVQIPVDDPGGENDPITCELLAPVPVNAAIDAQACVVQWTPTYDQAVDGEVPFTVRVSDDDGASAELGFVCRPQWRDEDDDGLPDSWEEDNGLDPTLNDCLLDADNDGINNCDEFDQGTDPQVPWRVAPPVLLAPVEGEAVPTVTPDLLLENVDNPFDRPISYQYRVFADAELTEQVVESDWVDEVEPDTAWDVPEGNLADNTRYWWTARADDGVEPSAWADPAEFVVDDGPDGPSPPTILWPEDGDQIGDPQPDVRLQNGDDPDPDDTLTYACEISKNPDFEPVATRASGPEGADGTTDLTLEDPVEPNAWYYIRCRTIDSTGLTSEWSDPVRFSVGVVNEPPGPPTIIKPEHDLVTDVTRWVLVAGNAVDPDGDALTYKFWLSTDPGFEGDDTWVSGEIAEGPDGETAWPAPPELQDQTTYFWRVRARDQRVAGPAVTARFTVDLGNEPPSVPVPITPAAESVAPPAPTFEWRASVDPEDDPITYEIELYVEGEAEPRWRRFPADTAIDFSSELRDGRYTWRVRAEDVHRNQSAWSPQVPFRVVRPQPEPPIEPELDAGVPPLNPDMGDPTAGTELTGSGIKCSSSPGEGGPGWLLLLGMGLLGLRRRRR